jgi:AcrR family transcriptional regulator
VALRLIDDTEPGSFSMRLLADELGVGVMTLYGYVRDKEELYEAVTALAFAEAPIIEPTADEPWHQEIRSVALELYGICLRHPNLLAIVLADKKPNLGMFLRRERMLAALRKAGFPKQAALPTLGVLTSYILGYALAQSSALQYLPDKFRASQERFPALSEAADEYESHLTPVAFDYGLELLIRGLRERADEGAGSEQHPSKSTGLNS